MQRGHEISCWLFLQITVTLRSTFLCQKCNILFLVNKTNRCTEFQLYWYYYWYSILLLVANGSSQLHKMYQSLCTAKNSWRWAERLPETCRVVTPTKLEFSASVGFIHKESVTMHGHTIVIQYFIFTLLKKKLLKQ